MNPTQTRNEVKDAGELARLGKISDREFGGDRSAPRDTPKTDAFRDNLGEAGTNLREAATNAMPAAREQLTRVGENVAEKTESVEKTIESYVRSKPINSLLMAAGVGLFAGLFLIRR